MKTYNRTKIKALMAQIDSGQIKNDAARILKFIIDQKFSSLPIICDLLGMPEKTVSARLSGLQDIGIIEVVEPKEGEVDEFQVYKHQPYPLAQVKNHHQRRKAKFNQWKKRGAKEFSDFLQLEQLELNFD